ncbi:hypothetical protein Clacol_002545 [Clathrus columnatus]|uniref:Uncharacterized protein n=1 Tax=Clathrus columnatus TaxID=1419009 RepID=A0AAV5A6G4_9AGAM|nr:hypothetical protein Clacol_002545 [Clathrus columnatus]
MSEPIVLSLSELSPPLSVEILPRGLVVNRFLVNVDGKAQMILNDMDKSHTSIKTLSSVDTQTAFRRVLFQSKEMDFKQLLTQFQMVYAPNLLNLIDYTFTSNPDLEHPKVSLHGGVEGFDTRDWKKIAISEATLFSEKEKKDIAGLPDNALFTHISEDGDQGFPGQLLIEVLFAVSPGNSSHPQLLEKAVTVGSFYIVYRARLLEGDKNLITPVNLTQHWGFNLEASLTEKGQPTPDIRDHRLFIKSDNTLELDELALATGKLHPITNTPLGLTGARIGDNFPDGGYDSFYVFNQPINPVESVRVPLSRLQSLDLFEQVLAAPARTDPLVRLSSERSGFTLAFDSNRKRLLVYNITPPNSLTEKERGNPSTDGQVRKETDMASIPLAAWLHPEIAISGDTLLTSDELYNNFVRVVVLFTPPATG